MIMHDRFLVRRRGSVARATLVGSGNFTTEGLTRNANVLHTFRSSELAELYLKRQQAFESAPQRSELAKAAGSSDGVANRRSHAAVEESSRHGR